MEVASCTTPPDDPDYIEGAIELVIDGVEIIGKAEWDYVDQLWSYVVTMIGDLLNNGESSTYFPDQPISLAFVKKGKRVLVTSRVGPVNRTASVEEADLINTLVVAGRAFFEKLTELVGPTTGSYQMVLDELTELSAR